MRGKFEATVRTKSGNGAQVAYALLQRAGLVLPASQSLSTLEISEHFKNVNTKAREKDLVGALDLGPRSRMIQETVNGAYPDDTYDDEKFLDTRTRRTALAHALSILLQTPTDRRMDEAAYRMTILRTSNGCFGIFYWQVGSPRVIVRIRNRDGRMIKAGLAEIASALVSRKHLDEGEVTFAEGSSAGTVKIGGEALHTTFGRAVLLSPTRNEEILLEGTIKEVRSRATAVRYLLKNGTTRLITLIGLLLLAVSAGLFLAGRLNWFPHDQALITWLDQLFGRLATAAFGAVLVDAAIKYQALLKSLRVGTFARGAVIEWQDPTGP